jgi:hypothetical protein
LRLGLGLGLGLGSSKADVWRRTRNLRLDVVPSKNRSFLECYFFLPTMFHVTSEFTLGSLLKKPCPFTSSSCGSCRCWFHADFLGRSSPGAGVLSSSRRSCRPYAVVGGQREDLSFGSPGPLALPLRQGYVYLR